MNCSCGETVTVPEGGQATCQSCGRQHISCGTCGAEVSADATAVVLNCPYCDSPIAHQDIKGKPMYFPLNITSTEAKQMLLHFLLNRFGIPADFEKKFRVTKLEPVYIPIQVFSVTAQLNQSVSEFGTTAVIQTEKLWYRNKLVDHRFAARVKQLMDPDKVKIKTYPKDTPSENTQRHVDRFGKQLLARDKKRFALKRTFNHITKKGGDQIFYPLYEVTYQYGSKRYQSIVDGASGAICLADHPMSMGTRTVVLAVSMAMVVFTGLVTLGFGGLAALMDPTFVVSALLSGLTGAAASGRMAWTAVRAHNSKENLNERDEHFLDLPKHEILLNLPQRKKLLTDRAAATE